jgi:hypothetical protein
VSNTPPEGRRLTVVNGSGETATARRARETQERFEAKEAAKRQATAAAEKRRAEARATWQGFDDPDMPAVQLDSDPQAIRALGQLIDSGALSDTYVRAGNVVTVERPSGLDREEDEPDQVITIVDTDVLHRKLALETRCYEVASEKLPDGTRTSVPREVTPKTHVSRAVLSRKNWPNLQPLRAIVTAPTFRPGGGLVQDPGYDAAAQVIYAPLLDMERVDPVPSAAELWTAKAFIHESLLPNFPWVAQSRTNYIGMLVTPLIRSFLGNTVVPMLAIDATSPGTGKSLLASILKSVYSGSIRPWVPKDDEMRKAITSLLVENGGQVVVLDNVGKGETVDHPSLAMLLTARVWSDRILQESLSVRLPNDRLWIVTGNALSIGGDIASRTVLVRLDARDPEPSKRPTSNFALGDLEEWLTDPKHRAELLRHLLVLVQGWISDGAERVETPMRTFTPWASATAGFLRWMGETDKFLGNAASLVESDEEEAELGAFYARWHALFGEVRVKAVDLYESARPDGSGRSPKDWQSTYLVRRKDGQILPAKSLGLALKSERGRFRGGFRLNGFHDTHTKVWSYSVTPHDAPVPEGAQ